MNARSFNAKQYKVNQRAEWDESASGWKKWWVWFERYGQQMSDHLVGLAEIAPGQRVLDVATGIGEPAVTAARRVGDRGRVVATDLSPGMIAIAKQRATEVGLTNLEFQVADAEALDLPERTFDAALCRFGLMFLPDLPGTLARIRRQMQPGARIAASVWSSPEKVPFASLPLGVMRSTVELPPPLPEAPNLFKLSDRALLERAFTDAGYSDVSIHSRQLAMQFESPQAYVDFIRDVAAPINSLLASQTPAQREKVWNGIVAATERFAADNGAVAFSNEAVCVVAQA